MGQGSDAAFGGGVAFRLRLTHTVSGRGDIDDACLGCEIGKKQFGEIKRSADSDRKSPGKLFPGTGVNPVHFRLGVVDETVDGSAFPDHGFCERFKNGGVGNITRKPVTARFDIDDENLRTFCPECVCDRFSDSMGTAGDHGGLSRK